MASPIAETVDPLSVAVTTPRRRRRLTGLTVVGLVLLAVLVAVAVVAPLLVGDEAQRLGGLANSSSTSEHPLGTDTLGRDVLARTLVATRVTLLAAAVSTALAAVAGIGIGVAVWLSPRRVREFALRLIEFWVSYPTLLVAIVVAAILGRGIVPAVLAIAVANTAGFARLTANLAAGLASRDFVVTARLMGVPAWRIALRHIVPNMAEPQLILIAQAFAGVLVELSGLSFIGLGATSPTFDWGILLNEGIAKIYTNPVVIVGPAAGLVIASLAALFVGDGLASAANPRSNVSRSRMVRSQTHARPADPGSVLAIDHLEVRHDGTGRRLLRDVSLTVRRGEILGVVGESGSGKSVLASVASRLVAEGLTASAARVELAGKDLLGKVGGQDLSRRVAMVYQDPGSSLNPALRLGSQLTDVLVRVLRHNRRDAQNTLAAKFGDVLITDPRGRLHQYPHQLSGGMKQRAMIASAMTVQADLLIADEPTTALDVTVQREVLSLIKRMNVDAGTSVLFISHDLCVVRALCDRVVVMKDGAIVEEIEEAARMALDTVTHPYTRQLLAATPSVRTPGDAVVGEAAS
ncbi:dipeptide/oligopeptide/nickel ABC transporter permease/ATP-binding protein [Kineococcus arenarius]|uniref:dipeptide/oligopeptide/nickel ABC transporter permease/ATP-binding protein n=1 Tax=unclassified Kineococcus TaxID=2621656 RepID=UPI003D7F027A